MNCKMFHCSQTFLSSVLPKRGSMIDIYLISFTRLREGHKLVNIETDLVALG
jgi:hypothetical protein